MTHRQQRIQRRQQSQKPRHKLTLREVERQCDQTKQNRRVLPVSWWDPAVQERMGEWLKRQEAKT